MPMNYKQSSLFAGILLSLGSLSVACSNNTTTVDNGITAPRITVLARNLDSPRGITLGPDGQLYVAEAGRGPIGGYDPSRPSAPSPSVPGAQLQFGTTGAIARIDPNSGATSRVLSNLPSVAIPANEPTFGSPIAADALGPTDITFADGLAYFLIGLGTDPANRAVLEAPQLGFLAVADLSGSSATPTYLTDIAAFEAANNPDGTDVVSNPYSLGVQGSSIFVLDAGANVLLQTDRSGGGLSIATLFNQIRLFPNPGIPGLPDPLPMQQVPTAISFAPDGQMYVSELTGLPFPVGEARVLAVNGSTFSTFLTGFTAIIDITWDTQGNLWVLEYDSDSLIAGANLGALIRVSPNGQRTTILSDLVTPTGVTVNTDGTVYVANRGFVAGEGEIIKVTF